METARAARLISPQPIVAIVLVALIPLGSATFFARSIFQFGIALLFLIAIARYAASRDLGTAAGRLFSGQDPTAVIALPALALIQTAAQFAIGFSTGPTLGMTEATMTIVALTGFYLLCRAAATTGKDIWTLLLGVAIIGAGEALYGLLNLLSGNEYLLFWPREIFLDCATGTLIGRAHFAYVMEIAAPIAAAFLAIEARRSRVLHATDAWGRAVAAGSALIVILLALLFSKSRMGIVALAGASMIGLGLSRFLQPETLEDTRTGRKNPRLAMAITAAVVIGFGLLIGVEAVFERFTTLDHDFQASRQKAWAAAWHMFLDSPIVGHGWGTYRELVVGYQPRPTGNFFAHAHNEYVEVLAEGGIIGAAIVGYLLWLFFRRTVSALARQLDFQQRAITIALIVSVTSVLLHSVADFGLRLPGIAAMFLATLAAFTRVTEDPKLVAEERPTERPRRRRRRRTRQTDR